MGVIKRFAISCKKIGLRASIAKSILRFLGIEGQKEEIDTLYYFLNTFFDASKLEPTSDEDLRVMQLCDASLLAILDQVFKKHGLDYWLDYGTLLGAVRHGGFIPWDDDTDISMPRKDYERALEILPMELGKYGITAEEDNGHPMTRIGVGYMHRQTGVWVDIFPVDEYYTDQKIETSGEELKKKIATYKAYYSKNRTKDIALIKQKKKNIIGDGDDNATAKLFYHGPEFFTIIRVFETEWVYPLQRIPFEGHMFNAPAKLNEYLIMLYGNNYMRFPRRGMEHHDLGRGPLKTWAKRNGVDMCEVYSYLKGINID